MLINQIITIRENKHSRYIFHQRKPSFKSIYACDPKNTQLIIASKLRERISKIAKVGEVSGKTSCIEQFEAVELFCQDISQNSLCESGSNSLGFKRPGIDGFLPRA